MLDQSALTPHVLAGLPVGDKIARANVHRLDLLAEIEAHRQKRPYETRDEVEERDGVKYRVVTALNPWPPPHSVGLIFGDFVHNLHAALDYLVGSMREGGPSGTSAFPICRTRGCFNSQKATRLDGVRSEAVRIVEGMQPYEDDGHPAREWWRRPYRPLSWLHELWNVEKHRTILLTAAFVRHEFARHPGSKGDPMLIGAEAAISPTESIWYLPLDRGGQLVDPPFTVGVSLAPQRGVADEWLGDVAGFELDGLANHLFTIVAHHVVPTLCQYVRSSP
jgi:hypothetical protein